MTPFEVNEDRLGRLLVPTDDPAVFQIKYVVSRTALVTRFFAYLFLTGFYIFYLIQLSPERSQRELIGITLAVLLMLFVVSLHGNAKLNADRRQFFRGYSLLGCLPLGFAKWQIQDGDIVQIRASNRDGLERHQPFHELIVRRGGIRPSIVVAHFSCNSMDPSPFFAQFGQCIATLLKIDFAGYVGTDYTADLPFK